MTPFHILPHEIPPTTPIHDLTAIKNQWFQEAHAACHITTIRRVILMLGCPVMLPGQNATVRAYQLNDFCNVNAILTHRVGTYDRKRGDFDQIYTITARLTSPGHKYYSGDVVAHWTHYAHEADPRPGLYIPGDWILPFLADASTAAEMEHRAYLNQQSQDQRELFETLTNVLKWE